MPNSHRSSPSLVRVFAPQRRVRCDDGWVFLRPVIAPLSSLTAGGSTGFQGGMGVIRAPLTSTTLNMVRFFSRERANGTTRPQIIERKRRLTSPDLAPTATNPAAIPERHRASCLCGNRSTTPAPEARRCRDTGCVFAGDGAIPAEESRCRSLGEIGPDHAGAGTIPTPDPDQRHASGDLGSSAQPTFAILLRSDAGRGR